MGDNFDIHAFLAQEAMEAALLAETSPALPGSNNNSSNFSLDGLPEFYQSVWPYAAEVPDGWLNQTLECTKSEDSAVGIAQPINGPCGVLAVIQAVLFAERLKTSGGLAITNPFSNEELALCLSKIFSLSSSDGKLRVATWKDKLGKGIDVHEIEASECSEFVLKNIEVYTGKGCMMLILYSIVLTKGAENMKSEFGFAAGNSIVEPTLKPDIWFCSSELMTLLLTGKADGNLGVYDHKGAKRPPLTSSLGIGLLSTQERQTGVPLRDEFKSPPVPVYILHGGDHFTTLAAISLENRNEFVHWNGLPPAGPKLTHVTLEYSIEVGPAPEKVQQTDFVPLPGEIYDVVQANTEDKDQKKHRYREWKYEVVLAIHDPSVKGPKRPEGMSVPRFELGTKPLGKWRCANCYRNRHQTFCFGENKPEEGRETTPENCKFCGKTKEEAQWSIWMDYHKLPPGWQRSMKLRYGPKMLTVLTSKWPDVDIVKPNFEEVPGV